MREQSDDTERILQSLRAWIRWSNKTYPEIAEASGLKVGVLAVALRGDRALRVAEVLKIVRAVGITPGEFFQELYGNPRSGGPP